MTANESVIAVQWGKRCEGLTEKEGPGGLPGEGGPSLGVQDDQWGFARRKMKRKGHKKGKRAGKSDTRF